MIYVGIDIASEKHDCCIVREDKKILSSFTFPNSAKGFALLLDELAKQAPSENIRVGLEATGIFLQAAKSVAAYSSTFGAYFSKKLNENKHYNVAASHCAKKTGQSHLCYLE